MLSQHQALIFSSQPFYSLLQSPPSGKHCACRSRLTESPFSSSASTHPDTLPDWNPQNPRERITIPELIKHPWVTLDGKFPIKSQREFRAEAAALEAAAAVAAAAAAATAASLRSGSAAAATATSTPTVRFSPLGLPSVAAQAALTAGGASGTGATASQEPYRERRIPREDYIHRLGSLSNREHTFQAGDVIMRQGDIGECVSQISMWMQGRGVWGFWQMGLFYSSL